HAKGGPTPIPHSIVWDPGSVVFTATGATTTLTFASTDPPGSVFGIALDDIRVIPDLGTTPPVTTDVNAPYLFRADPGVTDTHVEGVLGATPGTGFQVQFLRADGCDADGRRTDTPPVLIPGTDDPFIVNVTTGPTGRAAIDATIPLA